MSSTTQEPQPQHQPQSTNNAQPKSMDYHRQVLQNRLNENKDKHTYVSPSDDIMSPASQKLNAYKGKHFMKAKPQSLFARSDQKKDGVMHGENPFADKENEGRGAVEEGRS